MTGPRGAYTEGDANPFAPPAGPECFGGSEYEPPHIDTVEPWGAETPATIDIVAGSVLAGALDEFGMVPDGEGWRERQAEAESAAWAQYQADHASTCDRLRALGLKGDGMHELARAAAEALEMIDAARRAGRLRIE